MPLDYYIACFIALMIGGVGGFILFGMMSANSEDPEDSDYEPTPGSVRELREDILRIVKSWRAIATGASVLDLDEAGDDSVLVRANPIFAARMINNIEDRCKRVESHEIYSPPVPTNV